MNEWIIEENSINPLNFKKYESLACLGNGYMGIRNSLEEEYTESHRNAFINGVFNAPEGEVPELASLPDVTNFEIFIDGERVFMYGSNVKNHTRNLNMENGESERSLEWISKSDTEVNLSYSRFVSFVKKHIIAQKVTIKADKDVVIKVKTGIDGKITNSGVQHFGYATLRNLAGDIISLTAKTQQSDVFVSVKSHIKCSMEHKRWIENDRRSIFSCIEVSLKAGEALEFEKLSAYATSRDAEYRDSYTANVEEDSVFYLKQAVKLGYDELFSENAQSWKIFWENSKITIKSDNEFYQKAVNFALYHLRIMANRDDSRLGIGAKALTGEGYKGHSFWDTEIFIFPFYLYNDPDAARNLLEYRYLLLNASRKKAEKYGFSGAMYPWEGAWHTDGETCPYFGEPDISTGEQRPNQMGEIEVHINADIVYAVWQYYYVTGDADFMEKYGNEIVLSSAEFWLSRMVNKNGRFEILNVIGPDEYKENVDNNAYTNYMAHFNLSFADKILKSLNQTQRQELEKRVSLQRLEENLPEVLEKLYLPTKSENGIIPQFDGFCDLEDIDITPYKNQEKVCLIFKDYNFSKIKKMKVCKQADTVMLFYTLRNLFDKETIAKNFKYYEECTLHDSSLSMCIHSLVASRIGDLSFAEKLFLDCCSVDLGDKNDNSDNGIHSASIGGIWLSVVMGFGGVNVFDDILKIEPVLPEGISEYSFPLEYKGTKLFVTANKDGVKVIRKSGKEISLNVNGKIEII